MAATAPPSFASPGPTPVPDATPPQRRHPPCRSDCGACCIAPSISSPIPGMPRGKPAGVRCIQLTAENACAIFTSPMRPPCCAGLQASDEMCGNSREHALQWLSQLEAATCARG